jgi:hypothetical protein
MSLIVNLTSSEVAYVLGIGCDGQWQATTVVKTMYVWNQSGEVSPVPASPITTLDEIAGEGASSGLLRARELAPLKPKLDVLLAGAIAFPNAITEIDVELKVGSRLRKRARVFGDRIWLPGMVADMVPSQPRPVTRVPIAWERSYGGTDPDDPTCAERRNPAGSGVAKDLKTLHGRPAPNFEHPEKAIGAVIGTPDPIGFGPVAAHWQQRIVLAGAYDEAWEKSRRPLPPEDFSPAFFNVAPADQRLDGYLAGEEVRLHNLTTAVHDHFNLPASAVPIAFVASDDFTEEIAVVDTLVIEPEERRFSLLCKAQATLGEGPRSLGRIVVGAMTGEIRDAVGSGGPYILAVEPEGE